MANQMAEGATFGGGVAVATNTMQDIAEKTSNPKLFLEKVDFYMGELGFTTQQALRWADRSVRVDSQLRRSFALRGK